MIFNITVEFYPGTTITDAAEALSDLSHNLQHGSWGPRVVPDHPIKATFNDVSIEFHRDDTAAKIVNRYWMDTCAARERKNVSTT